MPAGPIIPYRRYHATLVLGSIVGFTSYKVSLHGQFARLGKALASPARPIGWLADVYPGVWGIIQLATGALSDRIGCKGLIVAGVWLQAGAILALPLLHGFVLWGVMALLGVG